MCTLVIDKKTPLEIRQRKVWCVYLACYILVPGMVYLVYITRLQHGDTCTYCCTLFLLAWQGCTRTCLVAIRTWAEPTTRVSRVHRMQQTRYIRGRAKLLFFTGLASVRAKLFSRFHGMYCCNAVRCCCADVQTCDVYQQFCSRQNHSKQYFYREDDGILLFVEQDASRTRRAMSHTPRIPPRP